MRDISTENSRKIKWNNPYWALNKALMSSDPVMGYCCLKSSIAGKKKPISSHTRWQLPLLRLSEDVINLGTSFLFSHENPGTGHANTQWRVRWQVIHFYPQIIDGSCRGSFLFFSSSFILVSEHFFGFDRVLGVVLHEWRHTSEPHELPIYNRDPYETVIRPDFARFFRAKPGKRCRSQFGCVPRRSSGR